MSTYSTYSTHQFLDLDPLAVVGRVDEYGSMHVTVRSGDSSITFSPHGEADLQAFFERLHEGFRQALKAKADQAAEVARLRAARLDPGEVA